MICVGWPGSLVMTATRALSNAPGSRVVSTVAVITASLPGLSLVLLTVTLMPGSDE